MRAILFDGSLKIVRDYPFPERPPGWACIRVLKAGICATDIEITRGYKAFKGVLGHEFVGVVEASDGAPVTGNRVVGEINVGCGKCSYCVSGLERHCPRRKTLGIRDLDGCMADFCVLPMSNLHNVPDFLSDRAAVFVEPLAAALELLEQLSLTGSECSVVLGDGKFGILCAWALVTVLSDVTLVGHHGEKLKMAQWRHLKTRRQFPDERQGHVDVVVEATGTTGALSDALALCRPRGTIVLKSTVASEMRVDLSPLVVNEQTLIGSRCGSFETALEVLVSTPDMPLEKLITAEYTIEKGQAAFETAKGPNALKVVFDMTQKG